MKIKKTCITITVIFYLALFFFGSCCLSYTENHTHSPPTPNTDLNAITSKPSHNAINKIFISKSPINLREGNKRENKRRDSLLFKYSNPSFNIRKPSANPTGIFKNTDIRYDEMLYSYFKERLIE